MKLREVNTAVLVLLQKKRGRFSSLSAWQAYPEAGYESLSVDAFRVVDPAACFGFSASKLEASITSAVRVELGVSDTIDPTVH